MDNEGDREFALPPSLRPGATGAMQPEAEFGHRAHASPRTHDEETSRSSRIAQDAVAAFVEAKARREDRRKTYARTWKSRLKGTDAAPRSSPPSKVEGPAGDLGIVSLVSPRQRREEATRSSGVAQDTANRFVEARTRREERTRTYSSA
jgi:hypothetical protein